MSKRALAFVIDAAIIFLLAWVVTFILAASRGLSVPDVAFFGENNQAAGLLWFVSIIELPLLLVYSTLLEAFTGRTPGKMIVGLRVARLDGAPSDLFHAFLRNLLRLLWVTPFGPAFVILDAWSLSTTELDQRLGDLAAGTVVIDERAVA